ncbi:ATP-dependent DNA helicase pif1-like [Phymastichus coffea]|uniref:ATP-dependent DNA helicase pif1-like n=1 Tax=Phymastichus coffea TaxID=108790 RepID=UPI00273C5352|nr:ATP-dependent DNA helicase pif1-like [Phymastichus coffea]
MAEAVNWMMPKQLRHLFVLILIHCQPIYSEKLWEKFKDSMSEDFSRNNELYISYQMAYSEINDILIKEGKSLSDFPTMDQNVMINVVDINNIDERNRRLEVGNENYKKLNSEQKVIVDNIIEASRSDNYTGTTCFYIDGQGGSGKTFVYTTIYNLLMSDNIKCSTMAYTGIAATLLPNGKTVHKSFGLPVPMFNDSSSNIKIQSNEGKILKNTKVFIWDEAPMAPRYALEIVNRTLKYIMNNDLPFGGKIMVLGGDFRQLLPIKVHGTRNEILNLSIKNSELWPLFSIFYLQTNMRALPHEIEFTKYLLDVGNGKLNDEHDNLQLPEHCILPPNECIVQNTFGALIKNKKFDDLSHCVILSARNVDVDDMNNKITDLLDKTTERIYTGTDSTENCDNGNMDHEVLLPEYLISLNPPNFPPHKLRLRKFCIVMLIRNISLSEGLCNRTRLQIIDFSNHLLKCRILTGSKRNNIILLNRITLYCDNQYPFIFKRKQFPVRLAFAMTINKAQGQTLAQIGIDLRRDVFNHGQLYVAMSRVRSWDSLKIYLGNQRQTLVVKNYIYTELYQ